MANIKSQKKRILITKEENAKNTSLRTKCKNAVKKYEAAIAEGNVPSRKAHNWVWRSLVARLNGVQEAGSSNLLTQTKGTSNDVPYFAFYSALYSQRYGFPKVYLSVCRGRVCARASRA